MALEKEEKERKETLVISQSTADRNIMKNELGIIVTTSATLEST